MNIIRRSFYHQFSVSKFNTSKDYYKVLGVTKSSDQKQIKKAFRDLAKKYHPDSTSGNEEKFKQVNEAYQVLSESQLKKQYDEARSYGQAHSTSQGYNQQYNQSSSGYGNSGYNNYGNSQYYYNQNFHPNYQHPSQQYRGYTRPDGWQNQKYRQDIMNEIFKEYQRNRSQYGSFQDMYKNHNENIRQYTDELKRRQESIRKAYEAEEMRKEREWREYQEKQIRDYEKKLQQKLNGLKEGFVNNVNGFFKVADFLKDTVKNVADTISKSVSKEDKKKKK